MSDREGEEDKIQGDEKMAFLVENKSEEDSKKAEVIIIRKKNKKKRKRLEEETEKAKQRRMDPHTLRRILSLHGDVLRIYLKPENSETQVRRQTKGRSRGQLFAEGWVEFAKKGVAKRVASMLNGQAVGGRKRSPFYYDLWNIKYLSKFKWSDLSEEIALKKATREQKLQLEISAAKKEKDFYLSKVDQSRALNSIDERLKKKQKVKEEETGEPQEAVQVAKVVRQFPQTKPIENNAKYKKSKLSKSWQGFLVVVLEVQFSMLQCNMLLSKHNNFIGSIKYELQI